MIFRILFLAAFAATSSTAADLNVRVHGGLSSKGQVLVALFASETDWMKSPKAETTIPINGAGEAHFTFSNFVPGIYGLSIFYDEDSDGELDMNLLGIPSEGFGFSNNARANFGPPKWSKVRFSVERTLNINKCQA